MARIGTKQNAVKEAQIMNHIKSPDLGLLDVDRYVCIPFRLIWTIDLQYHFAILLTLSVRNVNCTFEDDFRCGYQMTSEGEFSWYQHRASTPSELTGPDLDYTRKSPEGKT